MSHVFRKSFSMVFFIMLGMYLGNSMALFLQILGVSLVEDVLECTFHNNQHVFNGKPAPLRVTVCSISENQNGKKGRIRGDTAGILLSMLGFFFCRSSWAAFGVFQYD